MHAGGNLQPGRTELVFGIEHFTLRSDLQRAAAQARLTISQPQRSIHHVQIVIEKGKAQIVAYAVATMLIHPQRGKRARLRLKLLIKRREAAVEAHHQRQLFARGKLNQPFGILNIFCQRLIHADVDTRIEQLAHHLIVRCR